MLIYSFICSIIFTFVLLCTIVMLAYSFITFKRHKKKTEQDLQEFANMFGGALNDKEKK